VALGAREEEDVATLRGAIVDLGGRRFDGVAAVARLHAARLPVIAVAQHDDQLTRRRALAAGASRVFSYNRFFTDGPRLVQAWLGTATSPERPVTPAAPTDPMDPMDRMDPSA
jgi:CheY-like chemotaxis protein